MPTTRRVFIGLPAYNEEIALPRLLDRVERLTTSAALPITVVIYNDGSTDSTVPIARSRQQQMPLVILDCPINTVSSRLRYGFQKLRDAVGNKGSDL